MAVNRSQKGNNVDKFYLKDYQHAAKTFLAEPGYVMTPKFGFLFFVRIVFNQPGQSQNGDRSKTISVLCKSADLPKFNIEFETLNKYNQKEVLPKKLGYEPVSLTFHDDVKNTIRDMWLAYNNYYFADASITPEAWAVDDTYAEDKMFNRYGLDNNQTVRFIKSIDIYSMGNHKYTKYSLINPLIVSFDFDKYDYSDGAKTMETQLRVEYETVLYYEGSTENIPGFGKDSPYYDNQFSTLGNAVNNPVAARVIDEVEATIVKQEPKKFQAYQNEVKTLPIKISPDQIDTIRTVASNSLQNNRRFSFPTANEIKNVSSLVDLTGRKNKFASQGRIPTVGVVISNGGQINTSPPSTNGLQNASANDLSKLIVNANIPSGLTAAEREKFLQSYPPLPSTDRRTRLPPYV